MRTFKVKITPAPYELLIDADNLPYAVDLAKEYSERDIASYTDNRTKIDAVEKKLTSKQLKQFDSVWGKLSHEQQRSVISQFGIDEIKGLATKFALQEIEQYGLMSHFRRCVIDAIK